MATTGSVSKIDWSRQPRAFVFNTLGFDNIAASSVGAGVASTTIQSGSMFPVAYKICKVGVYVGAIDATSGDFFNLVVGTAAYTSAAASVAGNDNSFAQNLQGAATGSQYGVGYPTNVAVAGNTVFGADVQLNTTNVPNLTTSGGYVVLVPPNYDAVYPNTLPLTLRCVTNASTGSIALLKLTLTIEPVTLRQFWFIPSAGFPPTPSTTTVPIPGTDF